MSPKLELCLSQDPLLLPAAGRDSDWPLRARPLPGLCLREGGAGGQAGAAQPRHEGGHPDQGLLSGEHHRWKIQKYVTLILHYFRFGGDSLL